MFSSILGFFKHPLDSFKQVFSFGSFTGAFVIKVAHAIAMATGHTLWPASADGAVSGFVDALVMLLTALGVFHAANTPAPPAK